MTGELISRALRWAGLPIGVGLLVALLLRGDVPEIVAVLGRAGYGLLWLVPFHAVPLLFDARAWHLLLDRRASLHFLWWIASVREAVSRLLPSFSVGGELVGIRLACWRIRDRTGVSASVIVEVLITIAVQYAFAALGLVLVVASAGRTDLLMTVGLTLLLSLPVPLLTIALIQRGGIFNAIQRWATRVPGDAHRLLQGIDGRRLDTGLAMLMGRTRLLFRAFSWQLAGYATGAAEAYWALAMLGHPVSIEGALAIEALTQAVRHAAFVVPVGLGVQETAVMLVAQYFGVNHEVGLSLALAKRMREILFGVLALASWQGAEMVRARSLARCAGTWRSPLHQAEHDP